MSSTDDTPTRVMRLQRQIGDLEANIRSLRPRKHEGVLVRDEYYRLKGVWARKTALLAQLNR